MVEGGLEVEAHLQAGIVVPALQIKHLQAVFGAGGKDFFPDVIGRPMKCIRFILSQCVYKQIIERCFLIVLQTAGVVRQTAGPPALTGDDLTGAEIDGTVQLAVNAAQIQHQHIIYEDPNIIVTGELEHHRLLALGAHVQLAVFRLGKIHLHGHAHIVVRFNSITYVCNFFGAGENIGRIPILVLCLNAVKNL